MKNEERSNEKHQKIHGFVQILQFCSILGVFQGSLKASLGCPEASWRRLGGSSTRLGGFLESLRGVLEGLGGFLEASWGVLGASWTCLGENVNKRLSALNFWEGF